MVIMVLIVGDEAIYSKLSTLECEIFMQIRPKGMYLAPRRKKKIQEKIMHCSQEEKENQTASGETNLFSGEKIITICN